MSDILEALRFAAQKLSFIAPAQLEHRAKLVEEDFKVIGLEYRITCQEIPVPGWDGRLPYASYELLGSECDINHAVSGDRRHTSMSGGGLDRECLLYFSKVSEWAHANIPHLWPKQLRKTLRDPNQHLNTVCEVWWLSRLVGADFKTLKPAVPVDLQNPTEKNFDWEVTLSSDVQLRLEVKRRIGDIGRSIDVPYLKWKSILDDLAKFPPAAPPNKINVGCVRLFAPITSEVRAGARAWLEDNPNVSALVFHAISPADHESFAVISQHKLDYIKLLFSPPDHEDNTYIAPFWFAREIPGLPAQPSHRKGGLFKPAKGE